MDRSEKNKKPENVYWCCSDVEKYIKNYDLLGITYMLLDFNLDILRLNYKMKEKEEVSLILHGVMLLK